MTGASPEMSNFFNTAGKCSDMTVLERQSATLKWQQEHLHHNDYYNGNEFDSVFYLPNNLGRVQHFPGLVGSSSDLGYGSPELGKFEMHNSRFLNENINNNYQCEVPTTSTSTVVSIDNSKKRKNDKMQNITTKLYTENVRKEKRIKGCEEEGEGSKITNQNSCRNREASGDKSKVKSKNSGIPKPDFIHVRARRGHATDSHSLAERVRREKISERMKYLQDLVPGCNMVTGKAGMLDEIINYVQSLQQQIEFLSMKLAAVNPSLDFNTDLLFPKQVIPLCSTSFPSETTIPGYLQCNPTELGMSLDSLCFPQNQAYLSAWDSDIQSLNNMGSDQGTFPAQNPYTDSIEAANKLKVEM